MSKTVVIILAGGRGGRLGPLTGHRAKPAVPFAGKFRIIDFGLNNCLNSNPPLDQIIVMTQHMDTSLGKHLREWDKHNFSSDRGEFLQVEHPHGRTGEFAPFNGTADAVYENLYSILSLSPDFDLILAGDHIYQMDYRDLISFHREREADLTIAVTEVNDKTTASSMGIVTIDENQRIIGFEEKPEEPTSMPGKPGAFLTSMGVYVFSHQIMVDELIADEKKSDSQHDFGRNIIPDMIRRGRKVYAFQFRGYWRDVGTVESYYKANMDLVSVKPEFDLYGNPWRTYGKPRPSAKIVFEEQVKNSIVSEGCIIDRGKVYNSILSPGVRVGMDVEIFDSIIMDDVEIGDRARIVKAIIDKNNRIPADSIIRATYRNYELEQDRKPQKIEIYSDIIVIPPYFEPKERLNLRIDSF